MPDLYKFNRTRLAPTPSGYLHLGNVFSFALTAALARKTGAKILLRIDDLDKERVREEYVSDIFSTLEFLQIPWDEGPLDAKEFKERYSQIHRQSLYNAALEKLRQSGLVYACKCSRADVLRAGNNGAYSGACRDKHIPLDEKDVSWRLNTNEVWELVVNTFNAASVYTVLPPDMHDLIVRKKNGEAAYQLSSLADDLHFDVDLVVRGEDLRPSTLAQLYLAQVIGGNKFGETVFLHHPLLRGDGNDKLSKSAGDTSVQYLRKTGKSREDIFLMLGQAMNLPFKPSCWQDLGALF